MTRHDPAELRALQAAGIARGEPFSVPLDDLLIATEEREMAHPDAGKRCSRCGRPAYNCADPCVCDPADVAALLRASRGALAPKRGAK